VFLDATFDEITKRLARRDGTSSDPDAPLTRRYVEGQREYYRRCGPQQRADILVDNDTSTIR
jgi:uridine kinase